MGNHLIKLAVLFIVICITGCIEAPAHTSTPQKYAPSIECRPTVEPVEPIEPNTQPELIELLEFLAADNTSEIEYNDENKGGIDYFVCTGYVRTLAANANSQGIILGAVTVRNTPTVGVATEHYHAMNYAIVDNKFVIIEAQSDELLWLEYEQSPGDIAMEYSSITYHHNAVYRYISIYQNAQMMTNYGKGRETVDIDLDEDYNELEIIKRFPPQ